MDRLALKAFVSDVLYALALATMFFSTVLPFATVVPKVSNRGDGYLDLPIISQPMDFSTFSIRYKHYVEPSDSTYFYFGDYWFQDNQATQGSSFMSSLLVVTFAIEILTLAVGFSVFWKNRLFRILPLLMWISVTILLTYTLSEIFSREYFWPYAGIGYCLSYVPAVLVSASAILGRQNKHMFGSRQNGVGARL